MGFLLLLVKSFFSPKPQVDAMVDGVFYGHVWLLLEQPVAASHWEANGTNYQAFRIEEA